MLVSLDKTTLFIKPIAERQIEAKRTGALATIAQKSDLVKAELAFHCAIDIGGQQLVYPAGTQVFLVPDAAFQNWNKVIYETDGITFVRAPIQSVLMIEYAQ